MNKKITYVLGCLSIVAVMITSIVSVSAQGFNMQGFNGQNTGTQRNVGQSFGGQVGQGAGGMSTSTAASTVKPDMTNVIAADKDLAVTLPKVDSVEKDGPLKTVTEKNVGPNKKSIIVRPADLGTTELKKHPIFVWAPGGGAEAIRDEAILISIASHGFVVLSKASDDGGDGIINGINWILAENNKTGSPYYQKLNTSKIACGGHSMGSLASFSAGHDPRLLTTIHADGGSFDGKGPNNLKNPAAVICGLNDDLALSNAQNDYKNATIPIWFGKITGADHMSGPVKGKYAMVAWLRWHLGGETKLKDMFIGTSAAFNTGIWKSESKNWK